MALRLQVPAVSQLSSSQSLSQMITGYKGAPLKTDNRYFSGRPLCSVETEWDLVLKSHGFSLVPLFLGQLSGIFLS